MKSSKVIAIQGIPGSFHHQVALENFGEKVEILYLDSFEEVAQKVVLGIADEGIMAIENSIAGAIFPNYDLIDSQGLSVCGEYYLPIAHQLMALPEQKIENLREVQSHPMALLQCKKFLSQFHNLKPKAARDTATVAKEISENNIQGIAAIGSKIAADIYGLKVLAEDIQTVKNNFTRFIFLSKEENLIEESHSKASLKITIKNQPGSLAKLLTKIHEFNLDLSKIQSVPVIEKPWEYAFFIDILFESISNFKKCMTEISETLGEVKIIGTYEKGMK
ncbi:prephenate dehydratase [Algoriphagus sediminis]|uniref:prephenate dehydratase n=1 Tax=Algoriphagus sediminis TaxID=3057113 RepID=A0ABT7Y8W4_9BACT|nr:prephenate dehydratase [Algoriphagus sediminis]MDN3202679.1 prephenate dehydratase [Algoriphagus sediminis]